MKDYPNLKDEIITVIASSIFCLSVNHLFPSFFKMPTNTFSLTHKAAFYFKQGLFVKIGFLAGKLVGIGLIKVIISIQNNSSDSKIKKAFLNQKMLVTITNLAIFYMALSLPRNAPNAVFTFSSTTACFILTNLLFHTFKRIMGTRSGFVPPEKISIDGSKDISDILDKAIKYLNSSAVIAIIHHEKFEPKAEILKKLSLVIKHRYFSQKAQLDICKALFEKHGKNESLSNHFEDLIPSKGTYFMDKAVFEYIILNLQLQPLTFANHFLNSENVYYIADDTESLLGFTANISVTCPHRLFNLGLQKFKENKEILKSFLKASFEMAESDYPNLGFLETILMNEYFPFDDFTVDKRHPLVYSALLDTDLFEKLQAKFKQKNKEIPKDEIIKNIEQYILLLKKKISINQQIYDTVNLPVNEENRVIHTLITPLQIRSAILKNPN